tara:strand:+ start:598 stop:939 length:342 start_codon:yes stop_codon:yes gene_type:complete
MRKNFILIIILLFIGCKSDAQLSMERGIQFYEWKLFDKAILEFNQVVLMLPDDPRKLTYEETEMLSRAYYNLSIAHLKLGRVDFADNYILKAYQLSPTEENWNLLNDLKSSQK